MSMLRPMPTPMAMMMLRYQSRNFQMATEYYTPCSKNQFIHVNLRKLFLITAFSGQVQSHKIDCSIILTGVLSYSLYRRRHHRCSVKKVFYKNFASFTGKHLCWSLFLMTFATCEVFEEYL